MIFRRIPASVYAWAVGLIVTAVAVAIIATTSSWHRTTRDELFTAMSQPDAPGMVNYIFSAAEKKLITDEARTYIDKEDVYGCSWYHDSDRLAEYQCDIEVAFIQYFNYFVPFGYGFYKILFDNNGMMYGVVIMQGSDWKPGLKERPRLPKSPGAGPIPSGKPVVSSPSR